MKRKYVTPYMRMANINLEASGLCAISGPVQSQSSFGGKSARYYNAEDEDDTWDDLWGD